MFQFLLTNWIRVLADEISAHETKIWAKNSAGIINWTHKQTQGNTTPYSKYCSFKIGFVSDLIKHYSLVINQSEAWVPRNWPIWAKIFRQSGFMLILIDQGSLSNFHIQYLLNVTRYQTSSHIFRKTYWLQENLHKDKSSWNSQHTDWVTTNPPEFEVRMACDGHHEMDRKIKEKLFYYI